MSELAVRVMAALGTPNLVHVGIGLEDPKLGEGAVVADAVLDYHHVLTDLCGQGDVDRAHNEADEITVLFPLNDLGGGTIVG